MIGVKKPGITIVAILALAFAGCSGIAEVIEAGSKDPRSKCLSVYGVTYSGVIGIAAPGAKVAVSGGECTLEHPAN